MKDIKVIDIVKNNVAKFEYATCGVLTYKIETDTHVYLFPVDMNDKEDVGATRFEAEYKAITLMRYINKAIKNESLAYYEKRKRQHKYYAVVDPANEIINEAIDVFAIENDNVKLWNKIKRNSDYPLLVSNIFTFYDNVKAQEMTEKGKKFLEELQEKMKKNGL